MRPRKETESFRRPNNINNPGPTASGADLAIGGPGGRPPMGLIIKKSCGNIRLYRSGRGGVVIENMRPRRKSSELTEWLQKKRSSVYFFYEIRHPHCKFLDPRLHCIHCKHRLMLSLANQRCMYQHWTLPVILSIFNSCFQLCVPCVSANC
jgi:hypothetical protein